MQFSAFTKTITGNTILFKNESPIEKVGTIQSYTDGIAVNDARFTKKEFRWSFSSTYWSAWQNLTQSNFSKINTLSNYYLFLEIRYVVAATIVTIPSFTINYTQSALGPIPSQNHIHDDIETNDASAKLIHDVIQKYDIQSIVDAITLNGYPGSWYLNRANQKGVQEINTITGLQAVLNSLAGAAGITYAYVDGSFATRDASITWLYENGGLKGNGTQKAWNLASWFDNSTLMGSDHLRMDPCSFTFIIGNVADPCVYQYATVHIEENGNKQTPLFVEGSRDGYFEINIRNKSVGTGASSDIVATANNGGVDTGYIDMGINGIVYNTNFIGRANDSYLYSGYANNLLIGNLANSYSADTGNVIFFAGANPDAYVTEKMRITPNSILINKATEQGYILEVNGDVNIQGANSQYRKNGIPILSTYITGSGEGRTNQIAIWDTSQNIKGYSTFIIDPSGNHLVIGSTEIDVNATLVVNSSNAGHNTIARFRGNRDIFIQTEIKNDNITATADMVASANNATDIINYIDVGITNTSYGSNTEFGELNPLDGYLILNTDASDYAGNLLIGNVTRGKDIILFAGENLDFYNSEKLRITSDGSILIGMPDSKQYKLEVLGDINASGNFRINGVIQYNNAYIDNSLNLRLLEASIGAGFRWNAGRLDVSAAGDVTRLYVDGSLATLNASVNSAFINVIRNASLNQSTFKWVAGLLEPSVAGSISQAYIDGSLSTRDTSINSKVNKSGDTMTGALNINASLNVVGVMTLNGPGITQQTLNVYPLAGDSQAVIGIVRTLGTQNAVLGLVTNGANSPTNVNWSLAMLANTNNFSFSSWDGTSSTERLSITNAGNVGINVTLPGYRLEVAGSVKIDGSLNLKNQRIIGLATPVNSSDAVNKFYVDSSLTSYVPYSGATRDLSLGSRSIKSVEAIVFNQTPTITRQEGQLFYDPANETLNFHTAGDVTLQLCQEQVLRCYNETGSTILNGKVVYVTGYQTAQVPKVALAKADNTTTAKALGITTQDIPSGDYGFVNTGGIVNDISTNLYSANTVLYLSDTTAGEFTSTPVLAPSIWVRVASVIQNAAVGSILVNVQAGRSITTLYDVGIVDPVLNDVLSWNGIDWINAPVATVSAGAGITYFLSSSDNTIPGYKTMWLSPHDTTEIIDYKVVNSSTALLIDAYDSEPSAGLGGTQIDGGIWEFNTFASVSNIIGISEIKTYVYSRSITGVETSLFNVTTGEINTIVPALFTVSSVQPTFTISSSDRLIAKYYAYSDSSTDVSVNLYHGGPTYYTHIHTPLTTRHNDLAGIQGGLTDDYWHLSYADVSRLSQTTGLNTGDQNLSAYALITAVNSSFGATNSSVNTLYLNLAKTDASILRIDGSINNLYIRINNTDTSVGILTTRVNYIDACLGTASILARATNASISAYATNASVNTANFATNASVNTAISVYATNSSVNLAFASNASLGNLTVKALYLDACLGTASILARATNASISAYATNASVNTALGAYATNVSVNTAFLTNSSLGILSVLTYSNNASIGWLKIYTDGSLTSMRLNRLADVSISNLLNNSILTYDSSWGLWINSVTENASDYFALKTHNHDTIYVKEASLSASLFKWNGAYLEPSVAGSVTKVYVDGSLATLQTYVDLSLNQRLKEASLGSSFLWTNGILDVSIPGGGVTQLYVDTADNAIKALYIPNSSLNTSYFKWTAGGYLEPSIAGGVSQVYVDGSLATLNASVNLAFASNASLGNLTVKSLYLDACLGPVSILTYALNSSTLTYATNASVNLANFTTNASVSTALGAYATNSSVNNAFLTNTSLGTLNASMNIIYPIVLTSNVSIGTLTTRHNATEASLGLTDSSMRVIYPIILTSNVSIGTLTTRHNVTEASLGLTDASMRAVYPLVFALNTSTLTYATNSSVNNAFLTNASLGNLTTRVNVLDSSLLNTKALYIPNSSLNQSTFKWVNNFLEPSVAGSGGVSQAYVDGSLNARDVSIAWLVANPGGGAVSYVYVDGSLAKRDASIDWLKARKSSIGIVIDGGGSAITTGSKGYREIDDNYAVTGWTIISDVAGNIVVDVKNSTYATFPTTVSIAGTEKPTLTGVAKNQDLSLTTWTSSVSTGNIFEFNVDSATTVTKVWLFLTLTPR